ncbi:site-specific DNA-methyltransferase [Archaeoglobales archaeon]|nr:MAG: site-specific DNA-methyltransferase [Archaeoglobales archaeon]HDN74306.1 site-specific DNA-methyltransferase [Archaeoglobus sp.]
MPQWIRYTDVPDFDIPRIEEINGKRVVYDRKFTKDADIVLVYGDVLDFLSDIEDNFATLVVTSPPYNIGKPYESRREFREYIQWQEEVIRECIRILKPEGSICWEVGNYIENKEVFPLDIYFYNIFKKLGLKLRNRIIWHFGHGLHAKMRFSGRYETILWFTKSDNYIFNLDSVRIPQKYPGKRAYKGVNRGKPSCNPKGKNPSDVWSVVLEDWEKQIWNIPNVKSNHPEKTIHPAQFPIELVERLVLALTNEGDWVLDPFMGVGSALLAALFQNRRAVGVDNVKKYCDIAYQRTLDALTGKLKRRPLGKPVYEPSGREKIARPPPEWFIDAKSL